MSHTTENPNCFHCPCKECPLQKNADTTTLEIINKNKKFIYKRKGQIIAHEGFPLEKFYFIYKGKVKVVAQGLYGKQQIKRLAGNGEMLGFRAMGNNYVLPANIYALEDTYLCAIQKDLFIHLLHSNPSLMFTILQIICYELNFMENRMKNLTLMNVREKIADSLLYIYTKFGNKHSGTLAAQLSRQEIAELATTTKEQVSRVLSEFEEEGIIKLEAKKITIVSLTRLQQLSNYEFLHS